MAKHLLTMKEPSLVNYMCAYRGSNNQKCAIGVLIPDKMYTPDMEGQSVYSSHSLVRTALRVLGYNAIFCHRLQEIHDEYFIHRVERLRALAADEGLDTTVLDS